jgi:glycine oxidase
MTSSDVIIIGGGVIGLASAWRLAQAGLGVRLFERGRPGAEASSAALGVLLAEGSSGSRLENAWADLTQTSLELYPAVAAQLRDQTGVDVELRDEGVLDIALDSSELALLQEELAFQQAAGIPVTFLTSQEVRQLEPALDPQVRGALHFSAARQVDNVRLCTAHGPHPAERPRRRRAGRSADLLSGLGGGCRRELVRHDSGAIAAGAPGQGAGPGPGGPFRHLSHSAEFDRLHRAAPGRTAIDRGHGRGVRL